MVSFLDPSQLRAKIAAGFKGKLLVGTLTREVVSGVNEYGDPIATSRQNYTVNGLVDNWSQAYKKTAGIPEDDCKIILISGLCDTEPKKDDLITFPNFPTFQVRKVVGDPALAHTECQSFKI